MQNRNGNMWRAVPALFMLLYVVPPKVLSNTESTPAANEKVLQTIADTHALPEEQTVLKEQPELQQLQQLFIQDKPELDPTKPAAFLFDPLIDNGLVDGDKTKKPDNILSLTAIFIAKGRKLAVINGTILKEGEVISGREVKEITSNTVKLIEKQGVLELRLPSYSLKKEAS